MKIAIPFLIWTGKAALEVEIPDDTEERFRLRAAVEIAVGKKANLAGADLAGAYLADANLAGADLAGADLAGADLAGAIGIIDAGSANGYRVLGALRDGRLIVRIGCEAKHSDEWRADPRREDHAECVAALDYVEARAKINGWAI